MTERKESNGGDRLTPKDAGKCDGVDDSIRQTRLVIRGFVSYDDPFISWVLGPMTA